MTAVDSPRGGLRDWAHATFAPKTAAPSTATVLRSALWPVAILAVIHRTIVVTTNGNITDDFKPVYRAVLNFRHGWDIYNEHFDYVDPHYLYPPGGTLMMAPFGYLPFAESRYLFIACNSAAIVIAAYVLLKMFKFSLTLVFTNINGCILLLEVLFLRWLLDGRPRRQWWAGLAIGLTLVVKPLLGPLLLLPLLNRQWRAVAAAVVVPLAFNLAAWPLIVHPLDFVTRTVPYMLGVRDYFNSSIEGNGVYFGLPFWLILSLRILFTLLAIGSLWLLHRYYRTRDPLFWFTTSSGVLLLWSWLVLSLAQGYYSMMLFPFLMTVVLPNSVIRNWPAWLGIYGFLTMDRWLLFNWMYVGRPLEYLKITYGWSLVLIVVFTVLYFRYLDAKAENRLDDGIDPPWLTAEPQRASVEV
jgi:arabinofuranan 3-O-arabinosyltransferase